MDVIAHGLWAGAAGEWIRRRTGNDRRLVGWTVAFGIAPDLVQFIPVVAWSLSLPESAQFVAAYVVATPGNEPALPSLIRQLSHHAHCALHSIVVAHRDRRADALRGLNYAALFLVYARMFFSGATPGIPGAPRKHTPSTR
jgi:hypothetical protein